MNVIKKCINDKIILLEDFEKCFSEFSGEKFLLQEVLHERKYTDKNQVLEYLVSLDIDINRTFGKNKITIFHCACSLHG